MIVESTYWRRDLFRGAAEIRKKSAQRVWREASLSVLEGRLMFGAFALRRLIDSEKLPDDFRDRRVPCATMDRVDVNARRVRYPLGIDLFDAVGMFDFAGARPDGVPVHIMLNQIIHSKIAIYTSPDDLGGDSSLLIASDRAMSKRLLGFWLEDIALTFERAAITEPIRYERSWNEIHNRFVTKITGSRLDDRLVGWGYVSSVDHDAAIKRLGEPSRLPELATCLRELGQEIVDMDVT